MERLQYAGDRQWDGDRVVGQRESEVLTDASQGRARELDQIRESAESRAADHHVGGVEGDVGPDVGDGDCYSLG